MSSQAQINEKRLKNELSKPFPDPDIVYYLKQTRPYWNTIDGEKMRNGAKKLASINENNTLQTIRKERGL